jgi:hypothetical protein
VSEHVCVQSMKMQIQEDERLRCTRRTARVAPISIVHSKCVMRTWEKLAGAANSDNIQSQTSLFTNCGGDAGHTPSLANFLYDAFHLSRSLICLFSFVSR